MSLVKCPECKKKVSNIADACPVCGYPIKDYEYENTKKISFNYKSLLKKCIIISTILFTLLCIISTGIYVIEEYQYQQAIEKEKQERGRLFQLSYINPADIYGLSNENNILGEDVADVLDGYDEEKDYTISSNEYFTSYTFQTKDDYFSFEDVNLIIYTSPTDDKITSVEYQFKIGADVREILCRTKIHRALTNYYDVDPTYTYVDNYEIIDIDKGTFESLIANDFKSLYNIYWEGTDSNANYFYANVNEEASNICSVSFTD